MIRQIFEEYLQRVTGGDFLLSKRVWMAIGYLLIYPARGKFFIFMKGIGNSGKSVLGSFIRRLYPKESISSIAEKTGFSDSNYYSKVFSKIKGCSPREYRKNLKDTISHEL